MYKKSLHLVSTFSVVLTHLSKLFQLIYLRDWIV